MKVHDKTERIVFNILEYAENGALSDYIRYCGHLEEQLVPFLMFQICHAVGHLHKKGIAHLDIKLENILLDSFYNVKLADFGSALRVTDEKGSVDRQRGTMVYMAPEVSNHKNKETYDAFAADVYSLGITLFVLLIGEFPISAESCTATIDTEMSMQDKGISFESEIIQKRWNLLSEEVKELISQMT